MKFWHTEKVAYLILILTIIIPYGIMLQDNYQGNYTFILMAALWQYIVRTPDPGSFAIIPYGIFYILWYFSGLYIAKVAYDATKKGNWMRYDYAVRIVIVLVIQVAIHLIIPPFGGDPPPINIPLPIPGIIALLLTRLTVKEPTKVWDDTQTETPSEDEVFPE